MRLKFFLAVAFLFVFGGSAFAQDEKKIMSSPDVLTPNVSELERYCKTPVDYYTGTANITIPLTELRGKNITVPVSLSYYSSGHRPDSHPGWTGLGWSLNVGGCISRTVNGCPDEEVYGDVNGTLLGYMGHAQETQQSQWPDTKMISILGTHLWHDYAPDEFTINLNEIKASFYIYQDDSIRVVSKGDREFKANIKLNERRIEYPLLKQALPSHTLKVVLASYIEEIDIVADDGTEYTFGGDTTSIEFSVRQYSTIEVSEVTNRTENTNEWNTYGFPTAWHLTQIRRPDGEVITFKYTREGLPVIRDNATIRNLYTGNGFGIYTDDRNPIEDDDYPGIQYTFLTPCYLKEVSCLISGESMSFEISRSNEMKYPYSRDELHYVIGDPYMGPNLDPDYNGSGHGLDIYDCIVETDYYMQLDRIKSPREIVDFQYSDDSSKRLTLFSVDIHAPNVTSDRRYSFEYNQSPLPLYNSKMTDCWGFYNGKYYGDVDYAQLSTYRTPDLQKTKAEMLTRINYPTGGASIFEYEQNSFSKIVQQEPFSINQHFGLTGGLRIKSIKDLNGMDTVMVRRFYYEDSQGTSSGILSGMPIFSISGAQCTTWRTSFPLEWTGSTVATYSINSEDILNPHVVTSGNHITYSTVKEVFSDGGYTVYHYTNHDSPMCSDSPAVKYMDNASTPLLHASFNSKSIFRGLLSCVENYNNTGDLIQKTENQYQIDTTQFMYSARCYSYFNENIKRIALTKIFTGYPALTYQTVTTYADGGGESSRVVEHRTYSGRLLTSSLKTYSSGDSTEVRCRYSGQLSYGPYSAMRAKGMTAYPVEVLSLRNGDIIDGSLTEWRYNSLNDSYVPWKEYKLELSAPLSLASFASYDGQTHDSHYGTPEIEYTLIDSLNNITQYVGRDGIPVSVLWGYGGYCPVARITGVTNSTLESTYGAKLSYPGFLPRQIENAMRSAGEKIETWRWDPLRGVNRKTDASGRITVYLYDHIGRLILSADENGHATASQSYKYHNAQ